MSKWELLSDAVVVIVGGFAEMHPPAPDTSGKLSSFQSC